MVFITEDDTIHTLGMNYNHALGVEYKLLAQDNVVGGCHFPVRKKLYPCMLQPGTQFYGLPKTASSCLAK
jgi:hypothetical protein